MIRTFAVVSAILSIGLSAFAHGQSPPKLGLNKSGAGMSGTSRTGAAPVESGPCQIGVIPIAGDRFTIEKFGPLTFLDKYTRVSVAPWALDDLVVSRVRVAAPNGSVRRIPYTMEELRSGGRREQNPFFYSSAEDIKNFVRFLAPKARCERYVVVHRHGGTQREYGIGISQYPYNGPVYLFAMMYIRVYDGGTFELIKEAPALMTENTYVERVLHNPLGGPSRQLDRSMFPEKPADVPANPVLRDGVRAMLAAGLDKTLPALLQRPAPSASR